ncbi:rhizoferrin biosystnesis N-citrylornithine decarboxylase FslC [Faecalimonas canis]
METPYFLISESKLKNNILAFKNALIDIWPNSLLAYSVKTNSLPWLLKYLNKENVLAEVVSDQEYHLAKLCGFSDKDIVFNGPIKGEETLKEALKGKTYVNVDSQKDLEYIKQNCPKDAFIGVRVNVDPNVFGENDIGYQEDGFRFGFSEKNGALSETLETIFKYSRNTKLGLHLHCNSITRSVEVYRRIAKYAANIIKKYNLELSFIDVGGGFFGGVEGKPTQRQYISCIKEELQTVVDISKTKLIVEPGSAIIGSVVDLHTKVLDAKDTDYARIVTTDGSRVHIDPLWTKNRYMYSIEQKKRTNMREKQVVCGYTCMDHDRIMIIENKPELQVGDEIIYHRVGAYSMTFGGMFIRYYPDVFVETESGIEKVRTAISTEEYVDIHS